MIDSYLKVLLAENKRVIIPDFGGFVVKRRAGGDIISFDAFLNFNDDLLSSAIIADQGISREEALILINDAACKINDCLHTDGQYHIKEVGFLIKDKKDNLRFVETVTPVIIVPAEVSEDEMASINNDAKSDTDSELPVYTTADSGCDQEESNKRAIFWTAVLFLVLLGVGWGIYSNVHRAHKSSESTEYSERINGSVAASVSQRHDNVIEQKANEYVDEVVSLGNRSVADKIGAFFTHLFSKDEVVVVSVVKEVPEVVVAAPVMAPCQIDTISGIAVVADDDISPKGEERYNVIVGAFSDKQKAVVFSQQLIMDKHASEIFTRSNGFNAVSIGAYSTLDIAMRVSGESLEQTPDVWILVK